MLHPARRKTPPSPPTTFPHTRGPALCVLVMCSLSGCALPERPSIVASQAAVDAARPILTLDPNAVWTDAFNRLVDVGPAALDYLMNRPEMLQPAAPDDLRVLLHTSLVRLLADRATTPPHLSASCLETTLGLLHFDVKVDGHRIGTIVVTESRLPRTWPELYPADFSHTLAARIDVEADRRALRQWWLAWRNQAGPLATNRRLSPHAANLWRLLARRPADRWEYQPEPGIVLCAAGPRGPTLLDICTFDYNVVRAACVWLGSATDPDVEKQLIELVGSPLPVVAYNARFALRYSADERIQALLRRYDAASSPPP